MEFFVDTAVISEIKHLKEIGLIDGVTTNPSLILKSGRDFKEVIEEICDLLPGKPISAEVASTSYNEMVKEGEKLAKIAKNVIVKLPLTIDGLKACKYFSDKGIRTNITLCFSANQALLAAKAGATYISPFVGRLDDISQVGMELISQIRTIYDNYEFETKILVASIRNPIHVLDSAIIGADVATIPYNVILQLANHPLTESGLKKFIEDWQKTGQKI